MAKRIEGITIEIDGSTTKLNDALKIHQKLLVQPIVKLKH